MDSARLQPALLAGVFIGVLSALPIINAGNCCCCLWILAGGALAVYLRQQNSPAPIDAAEGALLGLLAGLIGGVIGAVLSIPIHMMTGPWIEGMMQRMMAQNPDLPPEARDAIERFSTGGAMRLASALINIVISTVFGMLGGLLGVAIFKKTAPPPPPAPPTVIPHDPGIAQ
jgi:hypothetical protein